MSARTNTTTAENSFSGKEEVKVKKVCFDLSKNIIIDVESYKKFNKMNTSKKARPENKETCECYCKLF